MSTFEAMKYGPIGRAVELAEPHTEADPVGVYAATLSLFSAAINGHVTMDTGRPIVVWTVLAGRSAIGRKGYALRTAQAIVESAIGRFLRARTYSGVSSGPSLVNLLYQLEAETIGSEGGVDGRALIVEEEWASVLKRSRRCPTFSQQLRTAWDGAPISNTTKGKEGKGGVQEVQHPLLGFHAHITPGEWAKYVSASEALGGSFNRILPVLVERSKLLPYNHTAEITEVEDLEKAYQWAQAKPRVMSFSADAGLRYDELRAIIEARMSEMPEDLSCYMERSAEQIARVAAVLTAAERKTRISRKAIEAAWSFVQYSMHSVEKLVQESAEPTRVRASKSLPDLIREILHRYAGEATSTLMLRALGARATAASLKATVEQMDDVEVIKRKPAGRGAPTIVYRLKTKEGKECSANTRKGSGSQQENENAGNTSAGPVVPHQRTSPGIGGGSKPRKRPSRQTSGPYSPSKRPNPSKTASSRASANPRLRVVQGTPEPERSSNPLAACL